MKKRLNRLAAVFGGILIAFTSNAQIDAFVPVTDEMLRDPPPGDWLMWRRTYDGWGYSPLDQINKQNVGQLQYSWSRAMEPGNNEVTPLVYNGILYLANTMDYIQALDARNGDQIWEYRRELPEDITTVGLYGGGGFRTRNIAIYGDMLFISTYDAFVMALDARTGTLVWETEVGDYRLGIGHSSGPIVADGKVISGRACNAQGGPEICFIVAHDFETGEELWRTFTIPRPGEPGDETWGDVPYESRWHIGTWMPGSYDPELRIFYIGTSVPAPSLEVLRGTQGLDVLYSNSTLALDVETGEMIWYYQHLPRDNWDIDHPYERVLLDVAVAPNPDEVRWINPSLTPGEERRVVTGIPGKTGIIYTLDRETGEFLWARETIYQNVLADIDPATGRVTINEELVVDPFVEVLVCPSSGGGRNYHSGAYSPLTKTWYQPQNNICMNLVGHTDEPTAAQGYATTRITIEDPTITDTPYPIGRVDAVALDTGEDRWTHQQRAGMVSAAVATGGGLVFVADANRRFMAFDDTTGEVLWETILAAPSTAFPVTYEVDGTQYVAISTGGGGLARPFALAPEFAVPRQLNTLMVFALPAGQR